ncbi:MAG: hypothetical protein Fur0019_12480 [Tibeticola sp.]
MFGILGLMGLKIASSRAAADADRRSTAAMYAHDILERARANPTRAANGEYNVSAGAALPSPATTIAEIDLTQWLQRIGDNLPSGTATFSVVGENATVTIQWLERAPQSSAGQIVTFSFTSRL